MNFEENDIYRCVCVCVSFSSFLISMRIRIGFSGFFFNMFLRIIVFVLSVALFVFSCRPHLGVAAAYSGARAECAECPGAGSDCCLQASADEFAEVEGGRGHSPVRSEAAQGSGMGCGTQGRDE